MKPSRAFSLVELLAVISILAILVALVVPVVTGAVTRYRIHNTGNQIAALAERARVHATTTGRVAVMRLYADPSDKDAARGLRGVELQEILQGKTGATYAPLTRAYWFESPVLVSHSNSTLLENAGLTSRSAAVAGVDNVPCFEVYFLPNGSTSLTATDVNPYLTIVAAQDNVASPQNPFVVSVDPVTARVTVFQR